MPTGDLILQSIQYGPGKEGEGIRLIFKDKITKKHYGAFFPADKNNYIKFGPEDFVRADVFKDAFSLYTKIIDRGKEVIDSQRGRLIRP